MVRATFADTLGRTVNLHLDADSVRPGLPLLSAEVVAFLATGGVIEPYEPPPPPLTQDEIDTRTLNQALMEPGTVTRAFGEILFGIIKGTIPVTPSITVAQFRALLKSKMRT